MGSTKVRRSKTLPWPPVILAMMSLPQRTSQVTAPISSRTMTRIMVVMILRFLDTGFFTFFGFLDLEVGSGVDGSAMLGSLVFFAVIFGFVASRFVSGVIFA